MQDEQIARQIAQTLCDRGVVPGDFLTNYMTLRNAGIASDDICVNYDRAAKLAVEMTEAQIARDLQEIEEYPIKVLREAAQKAIYLARFPHKEDEIVRVLENALAEIAA